MTLADTFLERVKHSGISGQFSSGAQVHVTTHLVRYAVGVVKPQKPTAHTTMAMFTPRNQIRNMLENQASQSLINNSNRLEQMFGLFVLSQQEQRQNDLTVQDNWLSDDDLWV